MVILNGSQFFFAEFRNPNYSTYTKHLHQHRLYELITYPSTKEL